MDFIKSLQESIPWVQGLPLVPKIIISLIVVAIASLFLLLVWFPAPSRAAAKDPSVLQAYSRMTRVLARLTTNANGEILVDGKLISPTLTEDYAPHAAIAKYIRDHPGDVEGAAEEIWNHGGQSRVFINDTQAFEAVVSAFIKDYETAKTAPKKAQ
jgi:hypothetical protein